jgi:hypothetical protein
MSTKDGKMIATDSKPRLDETTGMYRYYDEEGRRCISTRTTSPRSWSVEALLSNKGCPGAALVIFGAHAVWGT